MAESKPLTDREASILLAAVTNPGERISRRLSLRYGPAEAVNLLRSDAVVPGFNQASLTRMRTAYGEQLTRQTLRKVLTAATRAGLEFVTPRDPAWPRQLGVLRNATPHALWAVGNTTMLAHTLAKTVAVLGGDEASESGLASTAAYAKALSADGYLVVSAGKRGLDEAAHRAVLDAGGMTTMVAATGLDRPALGDRGARLSDDIVSAGGLILSEYPPGTRPERFRLERRSQFIAALSGAVLLTEAERRDGVLGTAVYARKYGRASFALPGRSMDLLSSGTNELIRVGYADLLVTTGQIRQQLAPRATDRTQLGELLDQASQKTRHLQSLISLSEADQDPPPARSTARSL